MLRQRFAQRHLAQRIAIAQQPLRRVVQHAVKGASPRGEGKVRQRGHPGAQRHLFAAVAMAGAQHRHALGHRRLTADVDSGLRGQRNRADAAALAIANQVAFRLQLRPGVNHRIARHL